MIFFATIMAVLLIQVYLSWINMKKYMQEIFTL